MVVRRIARRAAARRRMPAPAEARVPAVDEPAQIALVRVPGSPARVGEMPRRIAVTTYNVHRWAGLNGRAAPDPARAGAVINELDADVIALQEVLRPRDAEDPLVALAEARGFYLAFATTRVHRFGEIGNAILSRWPMLGVAVLDLSFSRMERRLAMAAQFRFEGGGMLDVVATHLALGDRTRHRQVRSLLAHPSFRGGPTLLMGDLNAWRRCKATRALDDELHHNQAWPASFPSARPVLALDRIYSRGARLLEVSSHASLAARRASDHLPVSARIELPDSPADVA